LLLSSLELSSHPFDDLLEVLLPFEDLIEDDVLPVEDLLDLLPFEDLVLHFLLDFVDVVEDELQAGSIASG